MATVAAVALTAVEPSLARAGSAPSGKGLSAATATSGATDFSARRRYYRGGGGAAAAAAFAGIVGTGLAIAATQNRRAYYDDYYGGGPSIMAAAPSITAVTPITAGMATARACPLSVATRLPAGNRRFPDRSIRRPRLARPADFLPVAAAVNTLATGLD